MYCNDSKYCDCNVWANSDIDRTVDKREYLVIIQDFIC